jgi:hypothetical protein
MNSLYSQILIRISTFLRTCLRVDLFFHFMRIDALTKQVFLFSSKILKKKKLSLNLGHVISLIINKTRVKMRQNHLRFSYK